MVENAITKVARIAAHAAQGLVYKDPSGKEQTILPAGDKNMIDISGLSIGNGSGGDTGGEDNPDHPSAGADYYAGSLSDGEITGRYLLYQRDESATEDPTTSKTVTLLRDVGTKFNMAGDGATFLLHLQKTAMTAGAKGDVSDIELNYDTNNTAKEGYFTTTSVYPVYIKSADLATTNELDIPIDGIGENLQGGKNFLAPHLKVKFNGDGTMTYHSFTGYDNDGNTAGATGANYDVVVDVIATFSIQAAVAQMPASVNFFSGSSSGQIALAGASDFLENTMDGIEITFDDKFYNGSTQRTSSFNILKKTSVRISKEYLINGFKFNLTNTLKPVGTKFSYESKNGSVWTAYANNDTYLSIPLDGYIEIGTASINDPSKLRTSFSANSDPYSNSYYLPTIKKITPYKD
ncbi:hypothetical protein [Companilactobacillus nantensis]|uniref:Uncharacterized protein n=1 Tax=Companilactobacillus nantensis DSM 16982 TaxID=1423774 RepID=A0A0R1WII4_9LACO|nr:hypothetical protein [Companilactobacillus nantensis]KRM17253.1 hypothetical protein FD31_GL000332 [Companilactobacillus nantensis DSM 16982]GEO64020.1 hypothetical protein LNA01_12030 [Companilactobacillus nantensis]